MSMNPEVKAKWVAALRSGDYLQTSAQLMSDSEAAFCCLGVLCDISGLGKWERPVNEDGKPMEPRYMVGNDDAYDFPVHAILDWAGIEAGGSTEGRTPKVVIDDEEKPLFEHNDDGKTFAQIADAIEEQL